MESNFSQLYFQSDLSGPIRIVVFPETTEQKLEQLNEVTRGKEENYRKSHGYRNVQGWHTV